MAIPDFQSIMLPMLEQHSDGGEYNFRDLIELLGNRFQLTEEERTQLLASGRKQIFKDRVGWAKAYLKKAGLLDSPRRAVSMISRSGLEVLKNRPPLINIQFLRQFPEFNELSSSTSVEPDGSIIKSLEETSHETPEETLDNAYQVIRETLAEELLANVLKLHPASFEQLVVELLVKMGYGGSIVDAGKAIGKSGDEGIDGTIKEDKLGLDIIYIQAKRWQKGNSVGRPEIQKFVGALAGQGAKKGIFITTSNFTREALEYIPRNETKIVLLDGVQLAQLMIDYNLGVTLQQTYEIKRFDSDYFGEE